MQPTVIVLCLTILVLFASTTTYVVTSILNYYATWMDDLLGMTPYMWFSVNTDECWNYPLDITPGWTNSIEWVQACGSPATLTTNVRLCPTMHYLYQNFDLVLIVGHPWGCNRMLESMRRLAQKSRRESHLWYLLSSHV